MMYFLLFSIALGDANFAPEQLVAWCIVPFDAEKRGPEGRAEMVKDLGLRRVAYDWRAEHVPTFEAEILAYKKHGLEMFAFWDWHPSLEPLVQKHGIRPQIWKTCPAGDSAETVGRELLPLARLTKSLGLKFGLYNHGGWGGEPKNLVAVCQWLRKETDSDHVGIVYNFHHGHGHIDDFAESLKRMKPYLLCLNLNGMNDGAEPKILPIGDGQHEAAMIRAVIDSGYDGPIGILDHRPEVDAKKALRQNLTGLKNLLAKLGEK